jgi:hypothetical protein
MMVITRTMSIFAILWLIAKSKAVELSGSIPEEVGSSSTSERNLQSWNCYDLLHSKSFGSGVLLDEQKKFVGESISSGNVLGCFLSCTNGDAQLYINFGDCK